MSLNNPISFYNPFPSAINPLAQTAQEQTTQWTVDYQLLQSEKDLAKFNISKIPHLSARTYTQADLEHLLLASKWIAWILIHDDKVDETQSGKNTKQLQTMLSEWLSILTEDKKIMTGDISEVSLSHLWQQTLPVAPTAWCQRFIQTMKDTFNGWIWEANNREQKRQVDLEEYKEKRIFASALYTGIDLIEFAEQIHLPEEVIQHPTIQKLRYYACSTACWNNDLFSYAKEQYYADIHNLVLLIQTKEKISIEEAAEKVLAIHNEDVHEFIRQEKNIPSFGHEVDAEVDRYVKALKVAMRGHLDWMIIDTGRFNNQQMGRTK